MSAKTYFERLYVVAGLAPIGALSHLSVCSHTPTVYSATVSRFPCNIFPRIPPQVFFVRNLETSTVRGLVGRVGEIWIALIAKANVFFMWNIRLYESWVIHKIEICVTIISDFLCFRSSRLHIGGYRDSDRLFGESSWPKNWGAISSYG